MATVTVVVFLYISNVLLCTKGEATNLQLYRENCSNFSTVTITDQRRLDELLEDSTIFSNNNDVDNVSKCIQLSFIGNSFQLDLLQLMRVNLGTNGSLMIIAGNSVILNCIVNTTDLKELRKSLQPISRALLVLFDGLVFIRCPVPIVFEEVSNVIIQNCVFL